MDRYLSFELNEEDAERSLFSDYTLANSPILPFYFGTIAPVNIFLGENNSGKSRFMREIIKRNPTRLFEFSITLVELKNLINNAILSINDTSKNQLFDIDVVAYQSAEGKELLSFFTKEALNYHSSHSFKISPTQILKELNEALVRIEAGTNSEKELLNLASNDKESGNTDLILSLIDSIKKVLHMFETVKHGHILNMHINHISEHEVIYAGDGGRITLNNYFAERFKIQGFLDRFSDESSISINIIIDACEAAIKPLRRLSKLVALERIRTYIPTLRTARTLIGENNTKLPPSSDIMKITTMLDYDLESNGIIVDSGFSLYDAIDTTRNARQIGRANFKKFEDFLSETFFNGKDVAVVAERVKDVRGGNILITIDGVERDIQHLGDGIQAIILLLYPIFIAPNKAWFFIEEPEVHLHPGFQRLFIETITSHKVIKAKDLTIFLTTHSNHVLDFAIAETDRINIFTFKKAKEVIGKSNYQIQLTSRHDLDILHSLGVQNSSVFLSNCTIWVEGITDRIYLTSYLRVYLNQLQYKVSLIEGLHYSFLEYAGANVAHYSFNPQSYDGAIPAHTLKNIKAMAISNRIMLIADLDAGKKTSRDERLTTEQHSGFEYCILDVREIENLLSPEVIAESLRKLYKKPFDDRLLNDVEYKDIYLGSYLRNKFPALPDNFAPATGSGTIGSAKKRVFAEKAAESITSWEQLSPAAKELTEQVFKFIMAHNPRLGSN